MLEPGPALRVMVYLNEDTSSSEGYLHEVLLNFLFDKQVAGASVFRPDAGFGAHHRLHARADRNLTNHHLPVLVEFVDKVESVNALLPELLKLITDGMVEVQETTILKVATSPRRSMTGEHS